MYAPTGHWRETSTEPVTNGFLPTVEEIKYAPAFRTMKAGSYYCDTAIHVRIYKMPSIRVLMSWSSGLYCRYQMSTGIRLPKSFSTIGGCKIFHCSRKT